MRVHHYLVCKSCADHIDSADYATDDNTPVELGFMSLVEDYPLTKGPLRRYGVQEHRPACDVCEEFAHARYLVYMTD